MAQWPFRARLRDGHPSAPRCFTQHGCHRPPLTQGPAHVPPQPDKPGRSSASRQPDSSGQLGRLLLSLTGPTAPHLPLGPPFCLSCSALRWGHRNCAPWSPVTPVTSWGPRNLCLQRPESWPWGGDADAEVPEAGGRAQHPEGHRVGAAPKPPPRPCHLPCPSWKRAPGMSSLFRWLLRREVAGETPAAGHSVITFALLAALFLLMDERERHIGEAERKRCPQLGRFWHVLWRPLGGVASLFVSVCKAPR